jgi:hypothetical protein
MGVTVTVLDVGPKGATEPAVDAAAVEAAMPPVIKDTYDKAAAAAAVNVEESSLVAAAAACRET